MTSTLCKSTPLVSNDCWKYESNNTNRISFDLAGLEPVSVASAWQEKNTKKRHRVLRFSRLLHTANDTIFSDLNDHATSKESETSVSLKHKYTLLKSEKIVKFTCLSHFFKLHKFSFIRMKKI